MRRLNQRLTKIALACLVLWLAVLPCLSRPLVAKAAFDPQEDTHQLTADDRTSITDTYYHRGQSQAAGTQKLKFWYGAAPSYFDGSISNWQYFYYIDGITNSETEIYLAVDSQTYKYTGLFWYDRPNKKFKSLMLSTANELINKLSDTNKGYILSLRDHTQDNIVNATPSTVAATTTDINCTKIKVSADYTNPDVANLQDLKGKFANDESETRVLASPAKPANGAKASLWWSPPGAYGFLPEPIRTADINDNGEFDLNLSNLKKGDYSITTGWSLDNTGTETEPKWSLNNLSFSSDLMNTMRTLQFSKSAADLLVDGGLTGIGLSPVTWAQAYYNRNPRDHYLYMGQTDFSITGENTVTCDSLALDVKFKSKSTISGGPGSADGCGTISMNTIFPWVFCEMAYSVKALADWAMCKAETIFATMTNMYKTGSGELASSVCVTNSPLDSDSSTGTPTTGDGGTDDNTDETPTTPAAMDLTVTIEFSSSTSYEAAVSGLRADHATYVQKSSDSPTRIHVSSLTIISKDENAKTIKLKIKTTDVIPETWTSITIYSIASETATTSIFRITISYPVNGPIVAKNG